MYLDIFVFHYSYKYLLYFLSTMIFLLYDFLQIDLLDKYIFNSSIVGVSSTFIVSLLFLDIIFWNRFEIFCCIKRNLFVFISSYKKSYSQIFFVSFILLLSGPYQLMSSHICKKYCFRSFYCDTFIHFIKHRYEDH